MPDSQTYPGKVIALFPEGPDVASGPQADRLITNDDDLDRTARSIMATGEWMDVNDAIGAAGAAMRALTSLIDFVADADGWLSVGLALDGMMPHDRSQREQNMINTILKGLSVHRITAEQEPIPNEFPVSPPGGAKPLCFEPPDVIVVRVDVTEESDPGQSQALPAFWESMWLSVQEDLPVGAILVREDIGFRDLQIAMQDEMARAFAAFAHAAGVHLAPGDAGLRIACSTRRQADPATGYSAISSEAFILIDGKTFVGTRHFPTQKSK